jgi:NADH/F420H2 dehydrogenase subunit C
MIASHAPVPHGPIQPGLGALQLEEHLRDRFAMVRDPRDLTGLTMVVAPERLREAIKYLRDAENLKFAMLLDVVGIDYLSFPDHRESRFAVVYLLKSLDFRHRLSLKVWVDEERPAVPSVHELYKSANWAEREVWDQYGIVFTDHPNLKRLLNHHEFIGHALRKDYPCQKRQKLSVNDMMIDQLEARLKSRGYTLLEHGEQHPGSLITRPSAVPHTGAPPPPGGATGARP